MKTEVDLTKALTHSWIDGTPKDVPGQQPQPKAAGPRNVLVPTGVGDLYTMQNGKQYFVGPNQES